MRIILLLVLLLLLATPVLADGNLSNRTMATETIALVNTSSYDALIDALGGNETYTNTSDLIDWKGIFQASYSTYFALFGNLAAIIIFAMPFIGMWIMQRDITLPGIVGIIFGLFVFALVPVEWKMAGVMMIAFSILATLYSLYTKGRG